ncbi:hypothetical protein CFC21_066587 [Triticum aestivum]|uniref:Uncharacterized protein n=4 Tax=Triticum TaxID=4564 RepID=A0A9R0TTD5_TRITD|nr:uncharacterized protein LOC119297589 [Triticum dicoccoides]XP_044385256.1 uncharacterized protein LOC123107335 [Triticum aestivum]XP_044385257.1 uncharacterized protein LOC123107335 [Triticum aestivum]XP_048575022.1 uncharacterized protein LOC125556312 [Triticum urartu]VAI19452.1 unnamed protein product [Triticum turgidum subsp. durum]KAF7059721.1 hypothetical protein CFC21_066587 [Triticum aestivum]
MKRQFVNLVLETCKSRSYTVRCIKSSSLFQPKKQNGCPLSLLKLEEAELPKSAFSLGVSTPMQVNWDMQFMPFGYNRDKILSTDQQGNVLVYDTCQNQICSMPKLRGLMENSFPINLGDALYLIERRPDKPHKILPYQPCFQALINGKSPAGPVVDYPGWHWHTLPPPPYVEAPGYKPSCTYKIRSCTVVRNKIWISASGIGTYSFNTDSHEWSYVGSWELPFRGPAEFVPELGRWLGFSTVRENQYVCASDLSTAEDGAVPALCCEWKQELDANPDKWQVVTSYLVRVDYGRFCVARLYDVYDDDEPALVRENFAVLTGLEAGLSDIADGGIQMVKHKSIRLNFDCHQRLHLVS